MSQSWEAYLAGEEAIHESPALIEVDLKWSLWSSDIGFWEERDPEAAKVLRAFPEKVEIHTAPRKEIRFGRVIMEFNGDQETATECRARGSFSECWDEPQDLADTLDLCEDGATRDEDDGRVEALTGFLVDLGFMGEGSPEVEVVFDLTVVREPGTDSEAFLGSVLAAVDAKEDELIKASNEGFRKVEEWAKARKVTAS